MLNSHFCEVILQNGILPGDGKQHRHWFIHPTFQYRAHFMLAACTATSAVGSSAVVYPPPPPPSNCFLCWFLLLYFTWKPVFFDSHLFSIYVVVMLLSFFACVCGNLILISPAGVCISIIIVY